MRVSLVLIALAVVGSPAGAQPTTVDASTIAHILNLPLAVEAGRRAGISTATIREVLDSLRRRRVPAGDAEQILRREVEVVASGAPKENFGAFVNSQLARGLRGRELAAAIHAEQARRPTGRSQGMRPPEGAGARRGGEPAAATDTVRDRGRAKAASDTAKGKSAGRRP